MLDDYFLRRKRRSSLTPADAAASSAGGGGGRSPAPMRPAWDVVLPQNLDEPPSRPQTPSRGDRPQLRRISSGGEAFYYKQSGGSSRSRGSSNTNRTTVRRLQQKGSFVKPHQNRLITLLELSVGEEEPEDPEHELNIMMGVVILLNTAMMAAELDFGPKGYTKPADRPVWYMIESGFLILFIIEICVRVFWQRRRWLRCAWNWFDLAVVLTAVVETWILPFILDVSAKGLRTLTLLRIVRLVRLIRVVRLIRFFHPLYVVMRALRAAMASILYIGLIMLLGLFVVAIFVAATFGDDPELAEVDMGGYSGKARFGSVAASLFSLFELMTLEGWENVGRPLVMTNPFLAIFLFGFIMIFTFGILNMLVAMVVEKTMREMRELTEHGQKVQLGATAERLLSLQQAFAEIELQPNTKITMDALQRLLREHPIIAAGLESLDVPTKDVEFLFELVDLNGNGTVTTDEILEACAQIQGVFDPTWDRLQRQVSMHSQGHYLQKQVDLQAEIFSSLKRLEEESPGIKERLSRLEEAMLAIASSQVATSQLQMATAVNSTAVPAKEAGPLELSLSDSYGCASRGFAAQDSMRSEKFLRMSYAVTDGTTRAPSLDPVSAEHAMESKEVEEGDEGNDSSILT